MYSTNKTIINKQKNIDVYKNDAFAVVWHVMTIRMHK